MPYEQPRPYRFVVETLLFLTYAVFGLSWIAITPLVPQIQGEFNITLAQLGMLTTMVSIAKVIAPLLTGLLAVRIGLKKTILIGSVCICAAALAPLASNFYAFLGARFVFGVGGAIVVTLLGPMVMQWFPRGELTMVNAVNNVAVNTGITLTYFLTPLLAAPLGWRGVLGAYAAVSVALAIAWAIFGRDVPPSAAAAPASPAASASSANAGGSAAVAAVEPARAVGYGDVWRLKETWLIAVCFAGPLALYLAFNTWLPKHYVEAYAMDPTAAAHYTGLFNLVGIPTAIAVGYLTKALGLRRPFIIGAGVLMGFAAFGMIYSASPLAITIAAVALGISLFTYTAPLFTIPMELPGMTPQHVSLMMGTVFSFAYFFSSFSPVVVGWMHDATGSFTTGLSIWAGLSFVLAIAGFLLPETGPRGAKPAADQPATT